MNRLLALLLIAQVSCSSDGLRPESDFAAKCANPRTGTDPVTKDPYPDTQGTVADEKSWVYSWIGDLYLWYHEVLYAPPENYKTAVAYFNVLKTPAITPSGRPKDQFHFTYPTATWETLSQSGVFGADYGVQWLAVSRVPPREYVALYTEPRSPGADAGIKRGAKLVTVDGVDVVNADDDASIATLNAGAFPANAGETHTFGILDLGATAPRTVTMISAFVTEAPVTDVVAIPATGGPVGYMLFKDFFAISEAALIDAVTQLKAAGVVDLVLDLRYNGGGLLLIASELAYMIAGPTLTQGKTFELLKFNDRYQTTDPDGNPITPIPFLSTTVGYSTVMNQPLPFLGLSRVFVLTGSGTCSASESVMNSLRGVDVQVIGIGPITCGKPYGFTPADNCGTTFFAIQFQGVNDKGFGDYADGFTPGGTGPVGLPGCAVADDLEHALGDPAEAELAAALAYRANGVCPPAPAAARAKEGQMVRSPVRENRILDRTWHR